MNESTKQLSGTPSNNDIGNHNVVININDTPVITQGQNVLITMSEDGAPTITGSPSTSAMANVPYNFTPTAK
ncbi:hypothetical protein [Candidatus Ruthia endofausta]|uniref:hypothetical protein n=1 Tax=Candidatus Ruthia endofausta TaxID=2738852 RepID=UPI003BF5F591